MSPPTRVGRRWPDMGFSLQAREKDPWKTLVAREEKLRSWTRTQPPIKIDDDWRSLTPTNVRWKDEDEPATGGTGVVVLQGDYADERNEGPQENRGKTTFEVEVRLARSGLREEGAHFTFDSEKVTTVAGHQ